MQRPWALMIGGTWRYVLREIESSRIAAGRKGAKCEARGERRMVTSGRCACYFRKPKKTHLNAVGGIAVPQSIFLSLAEEAFMRGTNWGKAVVGIRHDRNVAGRLGRQFGVCHLHRHRVIGNPPGIVGQRGEPAGAAAFK